MLYSAQDDIDPGKDEDIVREANERWHSVKDFQGVEDERTREDIKFANGDDRNAWQWPTKVYQDRTEGGDNDGVVLTINNTRVHNDLIINQLSKSNYGLKVRPTGGGASYKSAEIMDGLINRIQYISRFTSQRRIIAEHQVDGGIGYVIIETDYISERSHDQDVFLRAARDPTGVYLDPWIREIDGLDANFGFIFEKMPRAEFNRKYPDWKNKVGAAPLEQALTVWLTDKEIMLLKYYRKQGTKDVLVSWKKADGTVIDKFKSEIVEESGKELYDALIDDIENLRVEGRTRDVTNNKVKWYLIAGDKIIDRGDWAGKYIPICRCVGRETVIDGTLDRKGMTRSLIGAQRMLNYSASMSIEDVSSQPLASFLAPARAIEGQEQFKTMNINRFPVILWNDIDDEAPSPELQKVDAPIPVQRPQPSEGHITNMQAAERWGMMISGQFQAQMGENDTQSAASGKAINERQQQGDVATYHFPEHQTDMLRAIGVQLLDLIPKIYDTERTLHIINDKNDKRWISINPNQSDVIKELEHQKEDEEAIKLAFNPTLGQYECISDPGPDYATQRQEAWDAIKMIFVANKEMAAICGDLLFKYGDFPGADELMERLQKEIRTLKPYLFDDQLKPEMQALQQQNQRLVALNGELMQKLADSDLKNRGKDEKRNVDAYNAETQRMKAVIEWMSKMVLTPQQRAQMDHELESMGHQHIYDSISQANEADIAERQADTAGTTE